MTMKVRHVMALSLSLAASLGIIASPAGASQRPPPAAMRAAMTTCNKGIESDKPVTKKVLSACNIANVPRKTACSHGPAVYEAYVPNGAALLRVGHRPVVYSDANLYESEGALLCGDPIDPDLTAPKAPLSPKQVRALFRNN